MTMGWWMWGAAVSMGCMVWMLLGRRHGRLPDGESSEAVWEDPSVTAVMGMLTVVIRQGSSIPTALDEVGRVVGGEFGDDLCGVAEGLRRGVPWHEAWVVPCGQERRHGVNCRQVRDALEDAWLYGASPEERLTAAIERVDGAARAGIERRAAKLSVRLLMPTGLCFLPAFICVGVIPSVASFL